MGDQQAARIADKAAVQDLPCGCRLGGPRDRLCPYHEGYQDGWDACWTEMGLEVTEQSDGCVCAHPSEDHNLPGESSFCLRPDCTCPTYRPQQNDGEERP